jgi:hypothetical protein
MVGRLGSVTACLSFPRLAIKTFGQEMCRIAKNVFGKYLCLNLFEYSFYTKCEV